MIILGIITKEDWENRIDDVEFLEFKDLNDAIDYCYEKYKNNVVYILDDHYYIIKELNTTTIK